MIPLRLLSLGLTNTIFGNFIGTFPYIVLNVPQSVLEQFVGNSFAHHYGYELSPELLATLWGFLICVFDIGGIIGALITTYLNEKFGRKDTLFVFCSLIHLMGCVFALLAKPIDSFELLFIARLIFGISSGVCSTSMGVFLTECAPDRYRGFLGGISFCLQPIICIIAMVLGLPECLGTIDRWPYLLSFTGPFAFLLILISPLFPESPKYLYIECNDTIGATESIRVYHGEKDVSCLGNILNEYDQEARLASVGRESSLKGILTTRHLRIPFILSIVANLSQCTIGSDVVGNYSTDIIETLDGGKPDADCSLRSMLITVYTLCPAILSSLVSTALAERTGRKFLLISGLSRALMANMILMAAGLIEPRLIADDRGRTILRITAAFAFGLFNFSYYFGPASIPQYIYGEITPTAARSTVAAAAIIASNGGSTIYSLVFPPLSQMAGPYSFLITIVPTLVCLFVLTKWMPEPKGRSVDEIVSGWIERKYTNSGEIVGNENVGQSSEDIIRLLDNENSPNPVGLMGSPFIIPTGLG